MIKSRSDCEYYLRADRIARGMPLRASFLTKIENALYPDYVWEFQETLRKLEYHTNCGDHITSVAMRLYLRRKYNELSAKLCFTIPINVFGPGLSIAHYGTIIVNQGARVGVNCRIHACVNIGTEAGYADKAPIIGDNCYIGPGAKIYGAIVIADGTAIGANSVVNASIFEANTAVAGIPAKKIADIDTSNYLIRATELIDKNANTDNLAGVPARKLRDVINAQE